MSELTEKKVTVLKGAEFLISDTDPQNTFIPEEVNEEQQMIRQMVRDFCEVHIYPNYKKIEKQEDNMSPVIYPNAKRYSGWRLYNGKLLLISGGMKMPNSNKVMKETCDTTELMMMMRDSLVLRFKDHIQGYYRKANNAIR